MELRFASTATAVAVLSVSLSIWLLNVNAEVSKPYLDEVFHVPQAQHFCRGRFDIWDSKITTPPGLYIISYILSPILGCDVSWLRATNALAIFVLFILLSAGYSLRRAANNEKGEMSGLLAIHSAMNAVLFPPLFFFSALYYTDVPSTLSVFLFLYAFVKSSSRTGSNTWNAGLQVLLGVISLAFRQTNIFWVAVAPAAVTLVVALDRGSRVVKQSMYRRAEGFGDSTVSIVKTSWKYETIYDPPIRDAWLEDYLLSTLSIIVCALKALTQPQQILSILFAMAPFLLIIVIFGIFVMLNGSIVLGDKSNHVATINLPQMLYYWPYVVFFSWPLLLPYLLLILLTLLSRVAELASLEPLMAFKRRSYLPRVRILLGFVGLACAMVRFNTVVHPFMLADNRHYVFYVFKRLLRPWWVRYAVTPIYVLCGWACLESRAEPPFSTSATGQDNGGREGKTSNKSSDPAASEQGGADHALRLPDGTSTTRTTFVIISLATTAMQLCTAPLVEPRYFIVPWLIWRIHMPMRANEEPEGRKGGSKEQRSWTQFLAAYDQRLILETVWFLFINAVTGYVFLTRTFTWISEPMTQMRFMW